MPLADMQDPNQPNPSKEPPTPSQESYQITITVSSDGFRVDDSEVLPDLSTALKHVVAIYRENPIGEDAHAQLKAGYNSP